MPERGVREWLYEALELTLIGLKNKELKAVTLSTPFSPFILSAISAGKLPA